MAPTVAPVHRPDPASWRTSIGRRLREAREAAGPRLVDVARAARVSPPCLSEVERERKEASSEVLATAGRTYRIASCTASAADVEPPGS